MYYLISYMWRRGGEDWEYNNMVWDSSIPNWIFWSKTQPETYVLINSWPLNAQEYSALDGEVN